MARTVSQAAHANTDDLKYAPVVECNGRKVKRNECANGKDADAPGVAMVTISGCTAASIDSVSLKNEGTPNLAQTASALYGRHKHYFSMASFN